VSAAVARCGYLIVTLIRYVRNIMRYLIRYRTRYSSSAATLTDMAAQLAPGREEEEWLLGRQEKGRRKV